MAASHNLKQKYHLKTFDLLVLPFILLYFSEKYLKKAWVWEVVFFWKVNFRKVIYFLMFSNVMKNKLENIFQCWLNHEK